MKYTLLAIVLTLFVSCDSIMEEEMEEDFSVENEQEIADYITEHNLDAQRSETGLYYVITEPGTGEHVSTNSNVTVAYRGYFTDGREFDSNLKGYTCDLNRVIKGWTEGITYFREGGKGILLIPAHLAYGSRYCNGIPAGSVLIFEVELISVND